MRRLKSSRLRHRSFVDRYKQGTLDEPDPGSPPQPPPPDSKHPRRREYVRQYFRLLHPHRYAFAGVALLALIVASLQMVEPLFMRFIIDRVLLEANLDAATRAS